MAKFYYRARDRNGVVVQSSIEAVDAWVARKELTHSGFTVLSLGRVSVAGIWAFLASAVEKLNERVSLDEKLIFVGQLEAGFSVGIPILQVLEMVQMDTTNPLLRRTLTEIIVDLNQGAPLHVAFAKHGNLFSPSVIGLIKSGETSGELEQALGRIGKIIEQQTENRAKVNSAMFYPKIVVGVLLVVLFVAVYFIIPKIKNILSSLGQDLPPLTIFVVGMSDFFLAYWYLIVALIAGLYYGFGRWVATPSGRLRWDEWKLRVPSIGKIFLHLELTNFCVVLDMLVGSGISLLEALETLKASQENETIRRDIGVCQAEIVKGGTFANGLSQGKHFPASFQSFIAIGEETGRMRPVLQKLAKFYQVQVNYRLDNLSKLIEPVLLVVIFAMVTVLILAIMLPIWKISSSIRR